MTMAITKEEAPEITREEFNEWYGNKVTQYVIQKAAADRDQLVAYMVGGGTLAVDAVPDSNFCIGKIQGLTDLIQIQYEDKEAEKAEVRDKYGY